MRIKELHIEKFGTIKNLGIKFKDNMNYVHGLDEQSKKTVIDFILVMFYGTVNNYREDIREKYLPLDGSDMSGSVVFEFRNDEYLLERIFNAGRYKKDTIVLTNRTKETSENLAYDVKPGEYLFGASKDIFFRNTCINGSDNISDVSGDYSKNMSAVLSNLISTGSETTSVSDVAKMLNSYCDPGDTESITYAMNAKQDEINELNDTLRSAQNLENDKLAHQTKCNELHARYLKEQNKYQRIKSRLEVQDMMTELESINGMENSEQSFLETSDKYNQIAAELKKTRILDIRNGFDKAYEKYKRIKVLKKEQNIDLQQRTNLSVELGRYTPKGNDASLQNVVDLQSNIEKAQETVRTLMVQLDEKRSERNQTKARVREAKEKLEEAEQALTRHDEMSRNKLAQAETTLHSSSATVETKAESKSKNLTLAIVILVILIGLLIVFLNSLPVVIVLGIAIFSDLYAIIVKIGKEKKVTQYRRVDENELRTNERTLRNLRNQISSERDTYVSRTAVARHQYDEVKRKDTALKKQLQSLEDEIRTTEENLAKYTEQKDSEEKNITPPDPKFYTIRSEINEIQRSIDLRSKNIEDLQNTVLADLSSIRDFSDFSEAEVYIHETMKLLRQYDELSEKLSILGDAEKSRIAASQNQVRANTLSRQINELTGGREISMLSQDDYTGLQKMAQELLEENIKINDEYILEITKLKIQFNDSTCVANTEHRIHRLEREIKQIDDYVRSVKLAIDSYNEALHEVHDEYAPKVARRTSEILSELTRGKYTGISIKGGRIVVKDKDRNPVNLETVNRSTLDFVYIALRFAVAEVTCGKMNYPVILDDIFLRFSESKSAELLRFLKKYAEHSQLLIFSDSNRIVNVANLDQIPLDDVNIMTL